MTSTQTRIAYAANRKIGLEGMRMLGAEGLDPAALLVPSDDRATFKSELLQEMESGLVIDGPEWENSDEVIAALAKQRPDYLLMVHYPHILPKEVLEIPSMGTLNLHPAYLPYNRGWHTPTWAILEETPFGGTLHWVDEGIDTGPIALRKEIDVDWEDTAHQIYQKAMEAELDILADAIPRMVSNELPREPQPDHGTSHRMAELEESGVREIELDKPVPPRDLFKKLRALTTDRWAEAAYFEEEGERYLVQVEIKRREHEGKGDDETR